MPMEITIIQYMEIILVMHQVESTYKLLSQQMLVPISCLPSFSPSTLYVVRFGPCVTDLLEVGSKAVHILVVGQHGVGLSLEEVDVPDSQHSQKHRHILFQRRVAEMVVLKRD